MRIALAVVAVSLFAIVAVAVTAGREGVGAVASQTPFVRHTPVPAAGTVLQPLIGARQAANEPRLVGRFVIPVDDVDIPDDVDLLPGAPRDYRAGIHEGIDFPAPMGAPVHAAAAGTVIRVDSTFLDWTREQQEIALSDALQLGFTPAPTLDRIRGRQVWVDVGSGVVTRYAHLSAVEPIAVGQRIEEGALIGAVGSSGYPQGGPHLHFEVRIGDDFFGDGLATDRLVLAVSRLFR
jgi:murein DD-endopeptidase MepM/ murein hydrolase activator NlpD